MHENAHRAFVAELHSAYTPKIRRVVVHGRGKYFGKWAIVYTEIIPGTESDSVYSGYHGSTRYAIDGDDKVSVTWCHEKIKMGRLPIVTHAGVREPFPGWVYIAQLAGGKEHAVTYTDEYAGKSERGDSVTLCQRVAPAVGGLDASLFMRSDHSCRSCKKKVQEKIDVL